MSHMSSSAAVTVYTSWISTECLNFTSSKKSDITVVCKDMMYNDDVQPILVWYAWMMSQESQSFDAKVQSRPYPTPFPQVSMSSGDDSS